MAVLGGDIAAQPPLPGRFPWLVYYHAEGYKEQTFCCNISGPSPSPIKTYHKSIPVLRDKKVLLCSYGWLVLYDDNNKVLCLCNSTTFGDTIILPSLHHHLSNYKIDSCVLLPPPSSTSSDSFSNLDNFKLLIFFENLGSLMCYRVGSDHKWSEIEYCKQGDNGPLFFSRVVTCGGRIYALLRARWDFLFYFICSIEIVEEEEELLIRFLSWGINMTAKCTDYADDPFVNIYLLESCGELFFLYFDCGTLQVEVYRINLDTMDLVWETVKNIKDRAFFIGESYSLSCPVSGSGGIYFTKGNDKSDLYCYYMHDESVLVSLLHPNLPALSPIWIMPRVLMGQEDNLCDQDNNNSINTQGKNSTTVSISKFDDDKRLCNLPFDVLEQVSKHLIAVDYLNFRATSRMLHSVASPVNWRKALSVGSKINYFSFPLLMFVDQDQSLYKFVDHSNSNYYLIRVPNSLQGYTVISYSNDGWLLLSDCKPHFGFHLYNPFTEDIISNFPRYYSFGIEHRIFFFFPMPFETTHSYSIVSIEFKDRKVIVLIIDDPEEYWTWVELESNKKFEVEVQISPVLFENALYFLDQKGNVGKLEIDSQAEVSWEVLDIPQRSACFDSFDQNFLVECGGELISVFIGGVGKWVAVYKLNSDRVWEILTNLGSYDLYLSPTSCFSILTSGLGGNKIYFPWVRDSKIVFFYLSTGKWHFSGSQDSSGDFYGTRRHLNSCWIRPRW